MESTWSLIFGAGSRVCLGRHISLVEIHKLVPLLLREFVVEMPIDGGLDGEAEGGKERGRGKGKGMEWRVKGRWFTQQEGLVVRLRRRRGER